MRIVVVRGYLLEAVMGSPIRNSVGVIARRRALVVELVTDTGLSGWGETQDDTDAAWRAIETGLAGSVLGADPWDPRLDQLALFPVDLVGALAASAIDIALWDLRARALGVPLADLAGEVLRETVPAYASGPFLTVEGDPYEGMVGRAARCVDAGYRALKLRSGVAPGRDIRLVEAVRDRVGSHVAIMIDINAGYPRERAAELGHLSRGSGLAWIEEPVGSLDVEGLTVVAATTDVPLAAGESLWRLDDFAALVDSGAIAVLQPDLFLCGGISGMLRIAALADAAQIAVLPHVFGSSVNLAASLQVAAVLAGRACGPARDFPWFEVDQSDNPLRTVGREFPIDDAGCLAIPTEPGIGIALSADLLAPFATATHSLSLDRVEGR